MDSPAQHPDSPKPWDAAQMFWNPRRAGPGAARAALWIAMLILAAAGALAEYPLFLRFGAPGWVQMRMEASPEGMRALNIMCFLGLAWGAPILLPALVFVTAQALKFYFFFVLDVAAPKGALVRVTAYGALPLALERLLVGVLRWEGGLDTHLYNPLASNAAFFLPAMDTSIFSYEMARGLDVFALWSVVNVAFALAGLTGASARAALPLLLAVWLVTVFLRAWMLG